MYEGRVVSDDVELPAQCACAVQVSVHVNARPKAIVRAQRLQCDDRGRQLDERCRVENLIGIVRGEESIMVERFDHHAVLLRLFAARRVPRGRIEFWRDPGGFRRAARGIIRGDESGCRLPHLRMTIERIRDEAQRGDNNDADNQHHDDRATGIKAFQTDHVFDGHGSI